MSFICTRSIKLCISAKTSGTVPRTRKKRLNSRPTHPRTIGTHFQLQFLSSGCALLCLHMDVFHWNKAIYIYLLVYELWLLSLTCLKHHRMHHHECSCWDQPRIVKWYKKWMECFKLVNLTSNLSVDCLISKLKEGIITQQRLPQLQDKPACKSSLH